MKKINLLFSVVATFGFSVVSMAQVPAYVPTNGLQGWWPFTGNANDLSVNANNGVVNGATLTSDRFGNNNAAYFFNGTSYYISCNIASLPTGSSPRSISAWIQTTTGPIPTNIDPTVITAAAYGVNSAGNVIFGNFVRASTGKAYFETGSAMNQLNSITTVNDGTWHNIVMTYGGPGTRVKMYIDGIKEDSTSVLTLATGNSFFGIGKSPWTTTYFQGKIDDVGFWNRELTQNEITEIYMACTLITANCSPNQTVTIGNSTQFSVATSAAVSSYQWQGSSGSTFQNLSNNGQYSGVTSPVLNIAGTTLSNNNQQFRCVVTSGPCTFTSTSSVLTVNACTMSILSGPASQTVNAGSGVQMVVATNDPGATYQWVTDLGLGFQNLSNAGQYSGANTATLNVASVTISNNNQLFRCNITSNACGFTTSTATLTVSDKVNGMDEIGGETLVQVYPNPTSDKLTLTVGPALFGQRYSIVNVFGQAVLNGELKSENQELSLHGLVPGVYFAVVGNSEWIFKIVKSAE